MKRERLSYLLIIVACILYIVKLRYEINNEYKASSQVQTILEQKAEAYRHTCDSLNMVNVKLYESINTLSAQTDSLKKVKQTIIIKYERNISNLRNPGIVDNDSIDRYIKSKLNESSR